MIGVHGQTAGLTNEPGLGLSVSRMLMTTAGAGLARVGRVDIEDESSPPGLLVFQVLAEVPPSLIQDSLIEP